MCVPRDASEIEEAARYGLLGETTSFDAKAELPSSKKNAAIAVDVAAMSTDGGVLLYGVDPQPDRSRGRRRPHRPGRRNLPRRGPLYRVRAYPLADDPTRGYVAVIVPQSAPAPHQVTVGGDLRFYERGAMSNRRLTEGDVARLYQRRQQWDQDRDVLLAEAVRQAPYEPQDGLAYMHGFARPVAPDRSIWERASRPPTVDALRKLLANAAARTKPRLGYDPNLRAPTGGVRALTNGA